MPRPARGQLLIPVCCPLLPPWRLIVPGMFEGSGFLAFPSSHRGFGRRVRGKAKHQGVELRQFLSPAPSAGDAPEMESEGCHYGASDRGLRGPLEFCEHGPSRKGRKARPRTHGHPGEDARWGGGEPITTPPFLVPWVSGCVRARVAVRTSASWKKGIGP